MTFRSGMVLKNETKIPVEVNVFNSKLTFRIEPHEEISIPILSSYQDRLCIRPSSDFGYAWCSHENALFWKNLKKKNNHPIVECRSADTETPPFRYQVIADFVSQSET